MEMCIAFLLLEKTNYIGGWICLPTYIQYASRYFSISKFLNDKTQPVSIKLVSLMLLKCKIHPSGFEDNDAMKWKSKFQATVKVVFYQK